MLVCWPVVTSYLKVKSLKMLYKSGFNLRLNCIKHGVMLKVPAIGVIQFSVYYA